MRSSITTGNIDDDLGLLKDCDWIIEAVVERLEIKQSLYRKIEQVRRPGAIVSSNTSTIPLRDLVAGCRRVSRKDFLIIASSIRRAICGCWSW